MRNVFEYWKIGKGFICVVKVCIYTLPTLSTYLSINPSSRRHLTYLSTCIGRWIIREGHLYEDLMENSKCNISVKEVPRYIRKRVWEKQHSSSAPTAAQQATGGGKNNNSPRTGGR